MTGVEMELFTDGSMHDFTEEQNVVLQWQVIDILRQIIQGW